MKKKQIASHIVLAVLCLLLIIGLAPKFLHALQLVIQSDTIIAIHEDDETLSFFDVYPQATQVVKIQDQYAGYIRIYGENPIYTHPEWMTGSEVLQDVYAHITLDKSWVNSDDANDYILFSAKLTLTDDPEDDPLPLTHNWNIVLTHESGAVDNFIAPFVDGEVSLKYKPYSGQLGGMWYLNPLRFDIIPLEYFVVLEKVNPTWSPRLTEYSPYSLGKTAEDYSTYSLGKEIPFGIDPDTYTASSLGKDRKITLVSPVQFSVSRELETP
jgi:hypothetical protein